MLEIVSKRVIYHMANEAGVAPARPDGTGTLSAADGDLMITRLSCPPAQEVYVSSPKIAFDHELWQPRC